MMFSSPFYHQYPYSRNYYPYYSYPRKPVKTNFQEQKNISPKEEKKYEEKVKEEREFLEIFGIKLYLDDLILIGLLFFLYKEEVEDPTLFFALVFLLLS